jgi:flagellar FliL protein
MAEEKAAKENLEEGQKQKKSMGLLIIIIVVVVVLGAGGAFGWLMLSKKSADSQQTSGANAKLQKPSIMYPLCSFIVNLMVKKGLGNRYLKVTMELEIDNEESKMVLDKNTPQLRDTILLLLSSLSFKEISSMEGKMELKQALLSRIGQVLGEGLVHEIYFSEFVVQ